MDGVTQESVYKQKDNVYTKMDDDTTSVGEDNVGVSRQLDNKLFSVYTPVNHWVLAQTYLEDSILIEDILLVILHD